MSKNMPTPDADYDAGRGPLIMGILWTLTIVAFWFVAARLWVRKNTRALNWDDWFMLLALILQLVDTSLITRSYVWGLGRHDKDLTFTQLVNAIKWGWFYMFVGTFAAVSARLSISILLVRLFGVRLWFKTYIIVFTTIQCVGGIVVLLVTWLGTRPVQALWNPKVKVSGLKSEVVLYTAIAVQSIWTFADLTYVLLPVIIIWQLQLSFARRLGLSFLLCTSLITMTASILKAINLQSQSAALTDPEYHSSLAALLAGIEQTLVIIMGSVPVLAAATKTKMTFFSRLRSSISSRFGRYTSKGASTAVSSNQYHDLELQKTRGSAGEILSDGVMRTDRFEVRCNSTPLKTS